MKLPALGTLPLVAGAKLILAAVSPLQRILDQPGITHEFCNRQAVTILANDGYCGYARFLNNYIAELNAGVYWADKGWKNVSHYYEPVTRKGLWQFNHAIDSFTDFYNQALEAAKLKKLSDAVFYLGASAHLVQDLFVPHHARAQLFNGHKEYESWVTQNYSKYAVFKGCLNIEYKDLKSTMVFSAATAADLYDYVNLAKGGSRYHDATSILLPQAQRATAGLFKHFLNTVNCIIGLKVTVVA
ncbi:zinc dependent phospholipase C family protein [Dendrosporobacter sp. 1207_IL3150]|uniref:zinc dependent phospholipase C family protein n=1 Tax=Dendrosporobacter sp. 1207_IL3150 TaxID=3084054 RepID=UPI002FD90B21